MKRVVVKVEALQMESEQIREAGEFESLMGVALFPALLAPILIVSIQGFGCDERLQSLFNRCVRCLRTERTDGKRDV